MQRLVNTSPDVVDDACAFAWTEFLRYQPDRDKVWRVWLVTTAHREAWRLHRAEARNIPTEVVDEYGDVRSVREASDDRDHVAIRQRLRDALDAFAKVPERRRSVKALQVTGFSYDEIAEKTGLSTTRINHMLTEANAVVRDEQSRLAVDRSPSARAERLHTIEHQPPRWLVAAIGERPGNVAGTGTLAMRRDLLTRSDGTTTVS